MGVKPPDFICDMLILYSFHNDMYIFYYTFSLPVVFVVHSRDKQFPLLLKERPPCKQQSIATATCDDSPSQSA